MSTLLDKEIVAIAHDLADKYSDHPNGQDIAVHVADWMLYTLSAFGYHNVSVGEIRTVHDLRVDRTDESLEDSIGHMSEVMRHVGRIELPDAFNKCVTTRLNFIERLIHQIVRHLFFSNQLTITLDTVVTESVKRVYGSVVPSLSLDISQLLTTKKAEAFDETVDLLVQTYSDNPWLATKATELIFSFLGYPVPARA